MPNSTANTPSIGIIIVHPWGLDHTPHCLESLRARSYPNAKVILVDNGSPDGSGEKIREDFPDVICLRVPSNLGFTGGNNTGIEYALSNGCDHVLLLNNDTIVTPSFIEPLVERLRSDSTIAAVSGKIYYYPEAVGGKDTIIWYAGAVRKWHMAFSHIGEFEADNGQFDTAVPTAYASGCLMLLHGDVVRHLGKLCDDYFMYWEEADWCVGAQRNGYTTWYEPRSVIYHNVRSSIKGKESPRYVYLWFRNFLVFAKRNFSGIDTLRFFFCFLLHIANRVRICLFAWNVSAVNAIFLGILDYFRGCRGKSGLIERGLIKE